MTPEEILMFTEELKTRLPDDAKFMFCAVIPSADSFIIGHLGNRCPCCMLSLLNQLTDGHRLVTHALSEQILENNDPTRN